jgi:hypothetical protein
MHQLAKVGLCILLASGCSAPPSVAQETKAPTEPAATAQNFLRDVVAHRVAELPDYWIVEFRDGVAAGLKDPNSGISWLLFTAKDSLAQRFGDPSKVRVDVIRRPPIRPEDGVQVCYGERSKASGPSDFCITMIKDDNQWFVASDLSEEVDD